MPARVSVGGRFGTRGSGLLARHLPSYDEVANPWGASDGQVIDRYGLHWLIGFEGDESD